MLQIGQFSVNLLDLQLEDIVLAAGTMITSETSNSLNDGDAHVHTIARL